MIVDQPQDSSRNIEKKRAKQNAAFAAVKNLYECGEL
jgi:hypothetical protein